jgi:SecD/SecF fusion protein
MKNKGFIQTIGIILALICLYNLSFTVVTNRVEKKAKAIASEDDSRTYKQVIDSFRGVEVYNLLVTSFTYSECKEREINLGLDLQGGMDVTLEVSIPKLVESLAGGDTDPKFKQAIAEAEKEFLGNQDFVDLFKVKYEALVEGEGLARIFYRKELKSELPNKWTSTNEEIYSYLKKEINASEDRAYKIIKTRIDQFGVTQPNVQKLANGRILVELPGVDNPDRVRRILQSSAKLEFWEVYRNYDAYKFLESADKIVSRKEKVLNGVDTTDGGAAIETQNDAELLLAEDPDTSGTVALDDTANALTSVDTGSLAGLEGVDDTLGGDTSDLGVEDQLTETQYREQNPLLSRISLTIDREKNGWLKNAELGYVLSKDTAFFIKYLNDSAVKAVMPTNVFFKWGYKTTDDDGLVLQLFALKSKLSGRPLLEGDVISGATTTIAPNGKFTVSMTMNKEGAKAWKQITAKAAVKQDPIAIVLDDKVYSAPNVQGEIPNGRSEISGNFSNVDADDLSNILKAGRLDAPARIVEESVVGPSLGQAAINSGLTSLAFGFILVIVFMIMYYSKAGIYAVVALFTNLFFILGVLAELGAALTLPGMAGLVLTIGMAVDANVLIFERIKEETASGKGFKAAVKAGYQAAYTSIIDANITTLIAGAFLWKFGKGPIAGFAIILIIGIISSLFTAIFLTRMLVENDIKKGKETPFLSSLSRRMAKKFDFNFIQNRRKFYIISGLVIALGIGSMLTRGVATGVDFKGGWSYIIQVDGAEGSSAIKTAINKEIGEKENVVVKSYGGSDKYKITTSYNINSKDADASEKVKGKIITALSPYKVDQSDMLSESKVGPTIAEDIKRGSSMAIILSLIFMFGYIVLRFRKFGFGLGAILALFHDVLIVFSVYSIFHGILPFSMDIDQAFIAAILTIVGYSINDTVVVFDRVREFLGIHKFAKDTPKVINSAINQTLSRTLVTSLTTLIVVLTLFLFGGEGLKGFTFALLVGVAVGTYSSVFIATPIVVDMTKDKDK